MALSKSQVASIGGKVMAEKQRALALSRYYESPSRCTHCDSVIHPSSSQKISSVRKKKFCDHSCAATHNNKLVSKAKCVCTKCGKSLHSKSTTLLCRPCSSLSSESTTKEELRSRRDGYQSARSAIQKGARTSFSSSKRNKSCVICGYSIHVEICHKKSVSSFSADTNMQTINDNENLIALCRNHHWEFDNGILEIP